MVADGLLGKIRVVQAEYAQDWLTTKLEDTGQKQADWRTDPARSGPAGCTGDIAHPCHEPGRVHHRAGAGKPCGRPDHVRARAGRWTTMRTSCCASPAGPKACCGRARWRRATRTPCGCGSMASKAGWSWAQEDPNYLHYTPFGEPPQLIRRGGAGADAVAGRVTRIPAGPSGRLSRGFRQHLQRRRRADLGQAGGPRRRTRAPCWCRRCATVSPGVKFIEAVVESSRKNGAWVGASA